MKLDRETHNPWFDVNGRRYYVSSHAAQRAYEMEIPLKLIPHIIEQGERRENPAKSKYAAENSYYIAAGKVALAIGKEDDDALTIITIVWTTDEAWNAWFQKRGGRTGDRKFRSADYLDRIARLEEKGVTA